MTFQFSLLFLFILLPVSQSRPQYKALFPNGDAWSRPNSGITCQYLGHILCAPGSLRNEFGADFQSAGFKWTKELCMKDSDGDGISNGQELGDPCCKWSPDNPIPLRQTLLSHPGEKEEDGAKNAPPCKDSTTKTPSPTEKPKNVGPKPKPTVEVQQTVPQQDAEDSDNEVKVSVTPTMAIMPEDEQEQNVQTTGKPSVSATPTDSSVPSSSSIPVIPPVISTPPTPTKSSSVDSTSSVDSNTIEPSAVTPPVDEVDNETISPDAESPQPSEEDGSVCFPAHATVMVANGFQKRMDRLQVGDRVQVAHGLYSEVFLFTHRLPYIRYPFISITTGEWKNVSAKITLTAGHYLYVNGQIKAARQVLLGDWVEKKNGEKVRVIDVRCEIHEGLFNPQTVHGDIIVDGIRATTYTTAIERSAAHSLLAPLRAVYYWAGWSTKLMEGGKERLVRFLR